MAMTVEQLLTIEEYARLPDRDRPNELVRGRIVDFEFGTSRHGVVCGNVIRIIGKFQEQGRVGHLCCNDSGVITQRDPDTLRGADVSLYLYSRVAPGPLPWTYLEVSPNLVFEVFPCERQWASLMEKVREFRDAGVDVVCVVDDSSRTVRVYDSEGPERTLHAGEELTLPTILPGFRAQVEEFFED